MSFIKNIFPYIFVLFFFIPESFAQVTGNKSSTLEFDSSDTLKIIEDSLNKPHNEGDIFVWKNII